MLTDKDITKFQVLHKEEFGTDISKEQAIEQGTRLLSLMSAVYKPMTQSEHNQIETHRKATKSNLVTRLDRGRLD